VPISVGELLQRYPPGRITGWDPDNPPAVGRAFRAGFLIGAERSAHVDLEDVAAFEKRIHTRRGDIYYGELNKGFDRWSDRRAVLLRGATQGAIEMVRARAEGVKKGLTTWLDDLREWAAEDPIRLDWSSAKPPDPPESDSPPLGRDGVPKALWSEVFGWFTMVDELNAPATLVRQRGPFIETKEQYEKLRAAELTKLRERIRAHKGEFTGLEALSQYEPDVQAVWGEELAARAARTPGPVLVRVTDVQPELVRWLWPAALPVPFGQHRLDHVLGPHRLARFGQDLRGGIQRAHGLVRRLGFRCGLRRPRLGTTLRPTGGTLRRASALRRTFGLRLLLRRFAHRSTPAWVPMFARARAQAARHASGAVSYLDGPVNQGLLAGIPARKVAAGALIHVAV
jgi:hypothetical protein